MNRPLFLLLLSVVGCRANPDPEVRRVAIPEEVIAFTFGELDGNPDVEVLSRITVLALSESGRYLAVGNGGPPYVRVLDRRDQSTWSFGRKGDGPGELRSAWGMEFLGDSVLLVLSGQRVEQYTPTGNWIDGVPMLEYDLSAMSITSGCSGQLFVYGVPREYRSLTTVPWLHQLAATNGGTAIPRLAIPGRAGGSVRHGALFGVDGTNEGVFVWHRQVQSGVEAGYWVPCDGSEPQLIEHGNTERPIDEAFEIGGQMVLRTVLPDTLFGGAVAQNHTLARAFRWHDGDTPVTTVRVFSEGRCAALELEGFWTLLDLRQDILAVVQGEPFPRVLGVSWQWFEENIASSECHV